MKKTAAKEPITTTIKKATELYVIGGVAEAADSTNLVFWYAVRKYPVMSSHMREETGTKSRSEYIIKFRPESDKPETDPEYEKFYKGLPEKFEEGSPEKVEKTKPVISPSVAIIEPTAIEYTKTPTGEPAQDIPVVVEIIKKIRQLIWDYPVSGTFTAITGLQSGQLKDFINTNIKKAGKMGLKLIPETIRYISVATGEVFATEEQVKSAIEDYHEESLAVAASNKGGLKMNRIGELLKIADMLDEKGATAEADLLTEAAEQIVDFEKNKTVITKVVSTLVKVANSLDSKGAHKWAQVADDILSDIKNEFLPQGFQSKPAPATPAPKAEPTTNTATEVATPQEVSETKLEAPKDETPFAKLPDNKTEAPKVDAKPEAPAVEPVKKDDEFDTLTLAEFKGMIDGLKYRHSQGKQRAKYERIFDVAQKASEYKKAYEAWLSEAHKLFEDEPIRLKI